MDEAEVFARIVDNLSIVTVMATWLYLERKDKREQIIYYRDVLHKALEELGECLKKSRRIIALPSLLTKISRFVIIGLSTPTR